MTDPCFLKYIMNEVVVVIIISASISEEGKRHEVFNLLSPHHVYIIVDQFHDIDFGWDIRLDQPLVQSEIAKEMLENNVVFSDDMLPHLPTARHKLCDQFEKVEVFHEYWNAVLRETNFDSLRILLLFLHFLI